MIYYKTQKFFKKKMYLPIKVINKYYSKMLKVFESISINKFLKYLNLYLNTIKKNVS